MLPNRTASLQVASVDEIRSNFPALDRMHNGLPVAYFDGPGGTQTPRRVVEAMADYLYCHNANTHWNYPTSAETDQMIDQSRSAMADFLGAAPGEIVFGANSTTLAFHASRALGPTFEHGDEIVVTELDHHANVGPWQALHRERGCVLRPVQMNPATGELDWSDFESKITRKTKLVAIGAASNALGTINDVPRAVQLAHSVGALAFVDAVHYAPHHLVDVREWRLRFSHVLGLQVLRAAHRRDVLPARATQVAAVCQSGSVVERRARASRNGHAESRRHGRRGGGG